MARTPIWPTSPNTSLPVFAARFAPMQRIDSRAQAPLDADLSGLDALELPITGRRSRASRVWALIWPKLAALAFALGAWELVVWSGWRPSYVLPGPLTVLERLVTDIGGSDLPSAVVTTLRRAAVGFGLALLIGCIIGGVDQIPRILLRAGRMLGARGAASYRHVVLPAALPSFVSGLKQGWAFAWRSLIAGELLGVVAGQTSIGWRLQLSRELVDAEGLLSTMLVILVIGLVVDGLVFGSLDRSIRRRWGLLEAGS